MFYYNLTGSTTVQLDEAYTYPDNTDEMCPISDVSSVWREL